MSALFLRWQHYYCCFCAYSHRYATQIDGGGLVCSILYYIILYYSTVHCSTILLCPSLQHSDTEVRIQIPLWGSLYCHVVVGIVTLLLVLQLRLFAVLFYSIENAIDVYFCVISNQILELINCKREAIAAAAAKNRRAPVVAGSSRDPGATAGSRSDQSAIATNGTPIDEDNDTEFFSADVLYFNAVALHERGGDTFQKSADREKSFALICEVCDKHPNYMEAQGFKGKIYKQKFSQAFRDKSNDCDTEQYRVKAVQAYRKLYELESSSSRTTVPVW